MKPALFIATCFLALFEWFFRIFLTKDRNSLAARARWTQDWATVLLRIANARVHVKGPPCCGGIIASNHLSYVDILVIASVIPVIFVSKQEVRSWPLFGWLTRCAGTIFVQRKRRSDVNRVANEILEGVRRGSVVVVFPEGTSSGGATVLPFKTSLFHTAAKEQISVTPAAISYEVDSGSVADEICYWREMVFFPHFLNLMKKRRIDCHLSFGHPSIAGKNRKELAAKAHAAVVALKADLP